MAWRKPLLIRRQALDSPDSRVSRTWISTNPGSSRAGVKRSSTRCMMPKSKGASQTRTGGGGTRATRRPPAGSCRRRRRRSARSRRQRPDRCGRSKTSRARRRNAPRSNRKRNPPTLACSLIRHQKGENHLERIAARGRQRPGAVHVGDGDFRSHLRGVDHRQQHHGDDQHHGGHAGERGVVHGDPRPERRSRQTAWRWSGPEGSRTPRSARRRPAPRR